MKVYVKFQSRMDRAIHPSTFTSLRLIINKILLPSQLRNRVKAERLQTYLKNKYRDEIPESDHHL